MPFHILVILSACFLTLATSLPLPAETAPNADLPKLIAQAARFQSGQSLEPLRRIEQLLRDSAGKPALRAELEAGLIQLLAPSATFEARRFACQLLMVIGSDASLPALSELLKNDETVGIACLALSGQRSPKANELLRKALAAAHGRARLQIIGALGNHQDAPSVRVLAELARDADATVGEAAILALGKIGSPPAHDAIAALRQEARPAQARALTETALRVAEQLAAAGDRKAAAALYTELLQPQAPANLRRGVFAALLQLDPDGGEQRILEALRGRDPVLVPVAIARVAALKSDGVSRKFAAMLPELSPAAKRWMIEALASRGDVAACPALRAELFAMDPEVRRAAITAVGQLDDAAAVPLLAKALASVKSPEELQDVETALTRLRGGPPTDQALLAQLGPSAGEAKVRLFSVLVRRGARVAVPALLLEAGGSDPATAQAAFQALGKIAAAGDVPALLETLVNLKAPEARGTAESAAARVLAKISDLSQRSEIVRKALVRRPNLEARCSLLRLLPNAPDAQALAALQAAAGDKEPGIRDAAVRALAAWPDAAGWQVLLAIFQRPDNDTHRALALRALVRLAGNLNAQPDAALIERYRQLLGGARSDDERKLILGVLAGAAHPDALQLALPLLSNPGVRAETELAVKKIAAAVMAQHPKAAQEALKRLKQAKP